jgi:hypothetical protein
MTLLQWLRRYGAFIFLLPVAVYWADAFLTAWHHHGRESARAIVWENFWADAGAFTALYVWVRLLKPLFDHNLYHCTCPHCGFRWVCDPRHIPTHCPHCGKGESDATVH